MKLVSHLLLPMVSVALLSASNAAFSQAASTRAGYSVPAQQAAATPAKSLDSLEEIDKIYVPREGQQRALIYLGGGPREDLAIQIKLSKTKEVTCGTHWLVADLEKKEFQKDGKSYPFYEWSSEPIEAGTQTCGDSTRHKAELPVKGKGYFILQDSLIVVYYPKGFEFGYKRWVTSEIPGNPLARNTQNPFGMR